MRWPWQRSTPAALPALNPEWKLTLSELVERIGYSHLTFGNVSVTAESALSCSAVHGVIRAMTNAISSYPVRVEQWSRDGKKRVTKTVLENHPVHKLLQRPNAVHTQAEFFSMAMKHVALSGDFFAIKGSGDTGPISWLRPVEDPAAVTLEPVTGTTWAKGPAWKIAFNGQTVERQGRQLLHFTNGVLSSDGIRGTSTVDKLREAIGVSLAAETLLSRLYGNNDVAPYVIQADSTFANQDAYTRWMEAFKKAREDQNNETGLSAMILPPGMSVKELAFKPIDSLLIEVIKQKAREIFAGFGVPPHKVADLERATFSNIEELDLEFVRDTMEPHVERFSQAMGRDLLTEDDVRKGIRIRFDTEQATEGKYKDRVEAFAKGYSVGVFSPNDIRAKLGENPRDGGDDYVTPLNMGPSNDAGNANVEPGDGDPAGDPGEADALDPVQPD